MYDDTIKLLNFEQFNLKIKSLETTKNNKCMIKSSQQAAFFCKLRP